MTVLYLAPSLAQQHMWSQVEVVQGSLPLKRALTGRNTTGPPRAAPW